VKDKKNLHELSNPTENTGRRFSFSISNPDQWKNISICYFIFDVDQR
jgi:hypothetical protein